MYKFSARPDDLKPTESNCINEMAYLYGKRLYRLMHWPSLDFACICNFSCVCVVIGGMHSLASQVFDLKLRLMRNIIVSH